MTRRGAWLVLAVAVAVGAGQVLCGAGLKARATTATAGLKARATADLKVRCTTDLKVRSTTGDATGATAATAPAARGRHALLLLDVRTGRRLDTQRPDLLRTPVFPGSLAKIATLLAAFDAGLVSPDSTFACRRSIVVDGQTLTCSHPSLGRPLTLAEALAHSCNVAFDTIAARLRRTDLDRALLSLGLPPSNPSAPLASAALGLRGVRATPEQLLTAFLRATAATPAPGGGPGAPPPGRRVLAVRTLIDGLHGAAEYGTASALAARGLDALAKTGTARMPGGGQLGLLVAAMPSAHPTHAIVVLVPGGAGMHAAALAADRLALMEDAGRRQAVPRGRSLRVGHATASGRYTIETLDLEEYVARVVAGEAAPGAGLEAQKALALAVRTYALANSGRHAREGFDLCDLTHCQALARPTAASRQAAAATRGQVLRYRGSLASVFYAASCGGHTERPSQVWPGAVDLPYLPAREEPDCAREAEWTTEVAAAELARALRAAGMRGEVVRRLAVRGRSRSGRVTRIAVEGFEPAELDGEGFRLAVGRVLGWQLLKSTAFDITRTAGGYRFRGRGSGHGVGLCVAGAARMARAGRSAADIVRLYFPGVTIGSSAAAPAASAPVHSRPHPPAPDPRIRLSLPAGEERERSRVTTLVTDTLHAYSARLGVPLPPEARLVFHPTVEAYARATGQPWWTAAATRGTRIDVLPLSVLRTRGTLVSTLRHELAHLLTEPRLRDRAAWVKEGAAMYLAGEMNGGATGRAVGLSSPADEELRRPASASAMRDAYQRAARCFSRELAAGRTWDEVR